MPVDDAVQECRRLSQLSPSEKKRVRDELGLKRAFFNEWIAFLGGKPYEVYLAANRNKTLTWKDVKTAVCLSFPLSFLF